MIFRLLTNGNIPSKFELDELPKIISKCYHYFEIEDGFIAMCEEVVYNPISWYCESVDASLFDIDIEMRLSENTQSILNKYDEYGSEPNIDDMAIMNQVITVILI